MKATQTVKTKVIYFLNDAVPTEFDRQNAANIIGGVVFRNGKFAEEDGAIEVCDAVAGENIPALYAKKYAAAAYVPGYKPVFSAPKGKKAEKPADAAWPTA